MKKRTVFHKATSVILGIIFILSLLPTGFGTYTVRAATTTLYVGNAAVTETTPDVTGDNTISYDASTNTLTLTNATITDCAVFGDCAYGIRYSSSNETLTLVLNGTNTITAEGTDLAECYGICVGNDGLIRNTDTLQIEGTGSLTVTAGHATRRSAGIQAYNLLIKQGTVNAYGSTSCGSSYGICVNALLTISGGSITAIGGTCESEGSVYSCGISAGSTTYITGGNINAAGGKATVSDNDVSYGESYGFISGSTCNIEGGTTLCSGGDASTASTGISVGSFFNMKDGMFTASGGAAPESYGVVGNDSLSITGGENTTFTGSTQAYKNVNSSANTFGALGCTLFTKAGISAGTATDTTLSDTVLTDNQYVNVIAKMDITKTTSYGGDYSISPYETCVAKGTLITILPTAQEKYRLEKITVKGDYGQVVPITNHQFEMPGYPVTVTVSFELIPCTHQAGPWLCDSSTHFRSCKLCFKVLDADSAHIDSDNNKRCDICNYDLNTQISSSGTGNTPSTGTTDSGNTTDSDSNSSFEIPIDSQDTADFEDSMSGKPYVLLNVDSIPLQVGKTTNTVKIVKKYPSDDEVASYNSSNSKIAKVYSNGKVKAKKAGKATITITMKSGAKASYTVKVQTSKIKTKSIKLNKKRCTLKKGDSFTIIATKQPITATDKITYRSSNKKVATVNNKGKVVAKRKGTAAITVQTSNGKKATLKIKVK